ncbi:unnamed protein product [Spirodela intermedia]|uniref:Uncharacterized protein n=1 Tax=Spirodela intermedia TaxID=51605 RepID=A0A7I8IMA6_SPIIN|nr:unnamed protein product [Spirodela intermedia]CAA6658975.1 unnamed protein product [Spirodela intermedia]
MIMMIYIYIYHIPTKIQMNRGEVFRSKVVFPGC